MRNVTKEIFLNALVCPTLGWQIRNGEVKKEIGELTLGERFRIEQGIEIGRRARELYPHGLSLAEMDVMTASKKTKSSMSDSNIPTMLEGASLIDCFVARADVLKRKGKGWHLTEVKSSTNDRPEFIDDMAYTAMVFERYGFSISNVSLLLISKDFRLGMGNEKLFLEVDHTDEVLARMELFKPFWEQIEKVTRERVKPEPTLRFECRQCELFKECLGKGIDNHIFEIPRLSQQKFGQLIESGIFCIEDIPNGFPLTENQARVRHCVQTEKPFIGDGLKRELRAFVWPTCYLDFETAMTAIPLYPDIAPYTQIPTQYSIHKCSKPGVIVDHFEYLANPRTDCRRELAENLLHDLEGKGSIIVYGNFEKVVINSLARLYPDLSGDLVHLTDRMIDFVTIIRNNYYHPDFHGTTSIKSTLPVLVPGMSYENLEIADGDSAMAAFAYLALGRYQDEEVETVKKNLLDYCRQDTLALVKLHEQLAEYV